MPISISNRNRKALALSALGVLGAVANASAVTASADTTSNTDVGSLLAKAKTLKASDTYKNTVNNVTMDLDDAIKDAEGMPSSANDSTKESIADELNDAIYAVSDPDNQRVSDTQKSEVSEKAKAVQKLKDGESYDKYSEDLQEEIQNALDSVETFKSIPSVGNYNAAIGALKKANVDAEMEGSDSTSTSSAAGNNSFASVASSAANAFHTALGILDSVSSGTDTAVGSSTASKASSTASKASSNASSAVSNASNASNASSNASKAVNHTYYYDSMGKQIKNMTDGAHPDTGGNNAPEGYTFIGSYTLTDKDVAKKGDFYGMNMNAGDVINLYNAKNASSNASSAASNAIVSAVSSAESSASSAPSSASSSESSASSSASNISSAVSAISSAISGSLSEVSSVASDTNSASNSSSGASDASSAATNNVSSANRKTAKASNAPVAQAAAGSAGSAGGAGSTLPKTGSDAMSNAILAVMGLASTIGAGSIILRKKRKAE